MSFVEDSVLLYVKTHSELGIVAGREYRAAQTGYSPELVADSAGQLWEVADRVLRAPTIRVAPMLFLSWLGTGGRAVYAPPTLVQKRKCSVDELREMLLSWVRKRTESEGRLWSQADWDAFKTWYADFVKGAEDRRSHVALVRYIGEWVERGGYD